MLDVFTRHFASAPLSPLPGKGGPSPRHLEWSEYLLLTTLLPASSPPSYKSHPGILDQRPVCDQDLGDRHLLHLHSPFAEDFPTRLR